MVNVSNIKKAMQYSFTAYSPSHPTRIQTGIRKVVKRIKNNDMPSTPRIKPRPEYSCSIPNNSFEVNRCMGGISWLLPKKEAELAREEWV